MAVATEELPPIELIGDETIEPDREYELKLCFHIQPIPLLSELAAIVVQLTNEGEKAIKEWFSEQGYDVEILEKDGWWEWEIPYVSVKEVWFKYTIIPKAISPTAMALPALGVIAYACGAIILAAATLGLLWLIIKITAYLSSAAPVLSWIVVGAVILGGIMVVKEFIE